MPTTSFTFAHLSDAHLGGYSPHALFDLDAVVRSELDIDLERVASETGRLDAIFFGGDLAGHGKAHEYEQANVWLDRLNQSLGVSREHVYIVPGNHDVDWDVIQRDPVLSTLQETLLGYPVDELNARLEALLTTGSNRSLLLEGLSAYNAFAAQFECAMTPDLHRWAQTLEFGPLRLNIVGLCSPLLSGPGDSQDPSASRLALGPQGHLKRHWDTFTILMCHHPPRWLRDRAAIESHLERAHLQLYGHEHAFDVLPSGSGFKINAGAVHPERAGSEDWIPSYNVVSLAVDDARPTTVELSIRSRRLDSHGSFGPWPDRDPVEHRTVQIELSRAHPPAAAAEQLVEDPPSVVTVDERALARRFVELSPEVQLNLGRYLRLLTDADDDLSDASKARLVFHRARENNQLEQLEEQMASV